MRHIFPNRASVNRSSQGKGKAARNMAATVNTTTTDGAGGAVLVAVSAGGGSNSNNGGGHSAVLHTSPSSPLPDWTGDPVPLKDFASKRKVPGFARVVKGSYMTIGASKFSLQKQHSELYVHSVKVGVKVLAHCLRKVDGATHKRGQTTYTRLYAMDQRLAVPVSYQGWFELLSEDGKSARPFSSVPELAKAFPARCLVRENVKGYLSTMPVEGRMAFDKTKVIPAGEQLKLCGEFSLPAPSEGVKVKLLHCVDTKGDNVYLSFDQKGLFTPIAGETDFTGVFTIRDIVRRFRLPLTVKLVHGVRPKVPDSKFSGLIRLNWVYTQETAFVCPLERSHVRLLPVPSDVSLQLVAAGNQEELCHTDVFRSMQAKCTRMVTNYNNTLHLLVSLPESLASTQHRGNARASNIFSAPLSPPPGAADEERSGRGRRSQTREDKLMDEIDDLYNYVRDGGVAPKSKFQYDSDEESYWEEPAYEPLDEFRARLKAMESGQTVSFPDRYQPADPAQLKGLVGNGGGGGGGGGGVGGVVAASPPADGGGEQGPPPGGVPGQGATPRGPADTSAAPDASGDPPPLPPRRTEGAATPADVAHTASVGATTTTTTTTTSIARLSLQGDILKNPPADTSKNPPAYTSKNPPAETSKNPPPYTSKNPPADASKNPPAYTSKNPPAVPDRNAKPPVSARRVSAPLPPSRLLSAATPTRDLREATTATTTPRVDPASTPSPSTNPPPRGKLRSRSDSDPSTSTRPLSATAAKSTAVQPQGSQGKAKLGWKEKLRRVSASHDKDKEGSSSTSSDSVGGGRKGAQRLARDFKDSDISSRTKGSSGSSGGGRGARKRMQTLYL